MAFEWNDRGIDYRAADRRFERRRAEGEWEPAHPVMALEGLRRADATIEVYRKALEPLAQAFAQRGLMFGEVPVGAEWKEAIAEACRLMGIEVRDVGEDPK
jgi:hypothetical protein